MSRDLGALVVIAGPTDLIELAQAEAPDFWAVRSLVRIFEQALMRIPERGRLCWLHLSDLHFEATERWDRRLPLQALLRDLGDGLKDQGLAPRMVIVSGDIAQSGKQTEYEQAERFFAELAGKLTIDRGGRSHNNLNGGSFVSD